MNTVEKINPRHERPYRRGIRPAYKGRTRRDQLESKEQDNLRTERMRRNQPHSQFGNMETHGRLRHQHNELENCERPRRHFRWRSEEHKYHEGEVPFTHAGFRQRTYRLLHQHDLRWQTWPHQAKYDNPKGRAKHRWANESKTVTPCHRHWTMRPRRADDYRREDGEFQNRRIRDGLHQPQPSQQHRHWTMRPRHADEFRHQGGEFHNRRIRDGVRQAHTSEHLHPSQILREKWALERKLFRITRRIQRLNRQLRG